MRNDHTPGTEHFKDMLQNENARRLGPTVEGPRCEAVWAAPLRTVCCIFPAVTWKDARLAPLLVWDTPYKGEHGLDHSLCLLKFRNHNFYFVTFALSNFLLFVLSRFRRKEILKNLIPWKLNYALSLCTS